MTSVADVPDEVRDSLEAQGLQLSFQVDEETQQIQVEVKDTESGRVVRKIPSDEILHLSKSIRQFNGRLLDKQY